jgi:PKD repeat protein
VTKHLLSIILLVSTLQFFAQCETAFVNVFSDVNSGGASFVNWQVRDANNEIVFQGQMNFDVNTTALTEEVCLEEGCYTLRIIGNANSSESSFYGLMANAANIPFAPTEVLAYGSSIFNFPFCSDILTTMCNAAFTPQLDEIDVSTFTFINESSFEDFQDISFSWSFDDMGSSELSNPEFSFFENGVFEVCLQLQSSQNGVVTCQSESCQIVVVSEWFNENCPQEIIHSGQCGNYIFYVDEPDVSSVIWTVDGEVQSDIDQHLSYAFEISGPHEVCADVTSADCEMSNVICKTVNVNSCVYPMCTLEIEVIDLGNGSYEFTAFGLPEVYPMFWTFGDGASVAATWVVIHHFDAPGIYEVCGSISDPICSGAVQGCITITVEDVSECNPINFGIDSNLSEGGPLFLNYQLVNANSGEEVDAGFILYSNLDQSFDRMVCIDSACYDLILCDQNSEINWNAVNVFGGVGLQLLGWDEACEGGRVFHFSYFSKCAINPLPFCAPSFSFSQQESGPYLFENTSDFNGVASYYWDFGDGVSSTEVNPTHLFLMSGPFNVCLTISTSFGCSNTECTVINVVSTEELDSDLKVYPNPAEDFLIVQLNSKWEGSDLELFSLDGRKLISHLVSGNQTVVQCGALARGTYLLKLSSEKGVVRQVIQIH